MDAIEEQEATVVLLDVGPTMARSLHERGAGKSGSRRLDAAVAAVDGFIQQKIFFKAKDEVGIVVYGSEGPLFSSSGKIFVSFGEEVEALVVLWGFDNAETDNQLNEEQGQEEYRNVQVLHSIDTPTLRLCEKLHALQPSSDLGVKVIDRDVCLLERDVVAEANM